MNAFIFERLNGNELIIFLVNVLNVGMGENFNFYINGRVLKKISLI